VDLQGRVRRVRPFHRAPQVLLNPRQQQQLIESTITCSRRLFLVVGWLVAVLCWWTAVCI
jgi:hypothetical protein